MQPTDPTQPNQPITPSEMPPEPVAAPLPPPVVQPIQQPYVQPQVTPIYQPVPAAPAPPAAPTAGFAQPIPQYAMPQASNYGNGNLTRASKNPFKHMIRGTKDLLTTNLLPGIIAIVVSLVIAVIIAVVFALVVSKSFSNVSGSTSATDIVSFVGALLGFIIVIVLLEAYFLNLFMRIVLSGARKQKTTFMEAAKLALNRYKLTLLTYLSIAGAYVLALIILLVFIKISPIIGIVLSLGLFIASFILAFRIAYIGLVIVDDEKPSGVKAAFQKSSAYWKNSQGAIILLFITLLVISLIIDVIAGTGSTHATTTIAANGTLTGGTTTPVTVRTIIGLILDVAFEVAAIAGIADVYNEVEGRLPGESVGTPMYAPPAYNSVPPIAPIAPVTSFAPQPPVIVSQNVDPTPPPPNA